MTYDFRSRTASRSTILELIVKGALTERNVKSLVSAYEDDLIEEWEDEKGAFSFEDDAMRDVGILQKAADVERVMEDAYVAMYQRRVRPSCDRETALNVWVFPHGFPEGRAPRVVAVAVAEAIARRDAAEANALRDEMIRRQRG